MSGTTVEKTRRGVEMMEMEEDNDSLKAGAIRMKDRLTNAAREGWGKVMSRLRGKEMKREGNVIVVEEKGKKGGWNNGKGVSEEMRGEWVEESGVGKVEMELVVEDSEVDTASVKSNDSRRTRTGFGFLEAMEDEEHDEDLEIVRNSRRKRKRGEVERETPKGLLGVTGWEWREREGRGEKRWKREVTGWTVGEGDERIRVSTWEKVPLPDSFRLGLEERGVRLNHSGRPKQVSALPRR